MSNPTSADLSTCDCETWWDDQVKFAKFVILEGDVQFRRV